MKINYFSDIHLEFWAAPKPNTDAQVIIAAGDIGIYNQGLQWLKTLGKPVVYVAGNHEFYTKEYHTTLAMLQKEAAGSNVHFLENGVFVHNGVRFIGCTLWTDLFSAGTGYADEVQKKSNDYRRIKFGNTAFDGFKSSQLHKRSLLWLERELVRPFKGKTVVVTHHAPSPQSWPGAPNSVMQLAYCNNLKNLLERSKVSAWFHGHTHGICYYRLAKTLVLCNARGYSGEKAVIGFDINKTVVV